MRRWTCAWIRRRGRPRRIPGAGIATTEIEKVIRDYGEERFAHAIAKALVAARGEHGISTQDSLPRSWSKAVRTREPGQHPATRSFQALRIHVNRELEELSLVLPQCGDRLAPGAPGRDQLPFPRRPHRQALPARRGQPAAATASCRCAPPTCRRRRCAGRQGDLSVGCRSRRQSARRSAVLRVAEKP
jgi:hypothetical protein